jgi:hypothetical protein
MERRAASHTEEEEMNQRRRLLNAAKKGDQKAVAKLFELYQVRVYNADMVNKLNRAAATHKLQAQVAQAKSGKGVSGAKHKKGRAARAAHRTAKSASRPVGSRSKSSAPRASAKKHKK